MITKYIEFDIICDLCDMSGCFNDICDWHPDPKNIGFPLGGEALQPSGKGCREIRKRAKELGWIHKNRKDICPKCENNNK